MNSTDKEAVEGNLLSRIEALEQMVRALQGREVQADTLAEISSDMGVINAGLFVAAAEGEEPTAPDFTGVFMSAEGEQFGDDLVHVGGVNQGTLQFGLDAATGKAIFAGGAATIGQDAIVIDAINYAYQQMFGTGADRRIGMLGMFVPDGESRAAWALRYTADGGDEEVINGDFEDGDLTGWSGSNWVATSAEPHSGEYAATIQADFYPETTLQQTVVLAEAGVYTYRVEMWIKKDDLMDAERDIHLIWRDASGVTVKDHAAFAGITPYAGWNFLTELVESPAAAIDVVISIRYTADDHVSNQLKILVDDVSLKRVPIDQGVWFDPEDGDLKATDGLWPESLEWDWQNVIALHANGLPILLRDQITTSQQHGGYTYTNHGDVGDQYEVRGALKKGRYTLDLLYVAQAKGGVFDVYVDGVLAYADFSAYAASTTYNQHMSVVVTLAYSGEHVIRVVAKSGQAAGYGPTLWATRISLTSVGYDGTMLVVSGLNNIVDTWIKSTDPTANTGTSGVLYVGEPSDQTNAKHRALIMAGLGSVPSGAQVIGGHFRLYNHFDGASVAPTLQALVLKREWDFATATWYNAMAGTQWQVYGGTGANDLDLTLGQSGVVFTKPMPNAVLNDWVDVQIPREVVQGWVDGTRPNFGVLLKMAAEANDLLGFHSIDGTNKPEFHVLYV